MRILFSLARCSMKCPNRIISFSLAHIAALEVDPPGCSFNPTHESHQENNWSYKACQGWLDSRGEEMFGGDDEDDDGDDSSVFLMRIRGNMMRRRVKGMRKALLVVFLAVYFSLKISLL
ncbi:uncharacterized protein LOC131646133 isoform X2 [Vicia villosa]|uniref:uncharacterized protein LOC131646133 isoform X2 n=1 Tax=Vicia villosa TaxID=3911 RepID=UPI00273B157D|nr:uncharacterized protein LOC131646133 isoform X2 [Vicia villosa]XP_058772256.1 uncharacterized protein LOC131646133 isoform X2 [Vicia villosa]